MERIGLNEWLTIDELAAKLKTPKSWVYSRSRETGPGSIPRIKCGKYLRFREDEVLEWIKQTGGKI